MEQGNGPRDPQSWIDGYLAGAAAGYLEAMTGDDPDGIEEQAIEASKRVFAFGRWYDQALEREKWYRESRMLTRRCGTAWGYCTRGVAWGRRRDEVHHECREYVGYPHVCACTLCGRTGIVYNPEGRPFGNAR